MHWLVGAVFYSIILNGMYPRILSCVFGWVKADGKCSIEFEERVSEIRVMARTWERSTIRRVSVPVLRPFSTTTTVEATILGDILDADGPDTSIVSLHGGPHVLVQALASYSGSGYRTKLVEYRTFDLRLMKHCLQRTGASVSGSLDPFSMKEFVVNRLKGENTRDWKASRPSLRKAIIKNDHFMPGLVDVVSNVFGVWPLVVSYLNETSRKDDGDSLLARFSIVGFSIASLKCTHYCFAVRMKGMDGYLYHDQLGRMKFRLFHLLLEICKCHHHILMVVPIIFLSVFGNALVLFHIGSILHFPSNFNGSWQIVGDTGFNNVCDICSFSVANNFIHPQTANDYGYHSVRELTRLVDCRLQKIMQGYSLPLVEQWEQYELADHSKFPPIADEVFLAGTRMLAALNKIESAYLKREFRRKTRRFLE